MTGMKRYAFAAGAAVLSILLAACGSTSNTASAPSSQTSTTTGATMAPGETMTSGASMKPGDAMPGPAAGIVISGFAYSGTLTVKPGQKVTVTNKDSAAHTLTDAKTHLFDTGNVAGNGGTGTFTAPTKAGSYPFGCTYHPKMAGTLVVKG